MIYGWMAVLELNFLIPEAEDNFGEESKKFLPGEAEGDKIDAVKVPLGEAKCDLVETIKVPLGEAEGEVPLGEECCRRN